MEPYYGQFCNIITFLNLDKVLAISLASLVDTVIQSLLFISKIEAMDFVLHFKKAVMENYVSSLQISTYSKKLTFFELTLWDDYCFKDNLMTALSSL